MPFLLLHLAEKVALSIMNVDAKRYKLHISNII